MRRSATGLAAAFLWLGLASGVDAQRAKAPVDLTGYWESFVTEDWRWRMVTPKKGDYASITLTLNAEAKKVADGWDPARDEAAGEQCRSYGAGALMRVPGRIRVAWENDSALKVETEAGAQTRMFRFGAAPAGEPTWQGSTTASWQRQTLKTVTTNLRPGYLRRNGVPYGARAVVTEYYNVLTQPNGDTWLIVNTIVDDPEFLTQPFVTSSQFKKLPDGAVWKPAACSAR